MADGTAVAMAGDCSWVGGGQAGGGNGIKESSVDYQDSFGDQQAALFRKRDDHSTPKTVLEARSN